MAGDTTKRRFNPLNDASGILYQQGRVMLDQDWNELVDIMDRRWRAETVDVIGRAVVPTFTQDGFKIRVVGANDLSIGAGRIYVDGLVAENHGTQPQFDSVLEEMPGLQPLPFNQQPYMPSKWPFAAPNPFVIPTDGKPFLVFLDVWKREETYLQAPDLVDQAVGVDTATRTQTAWQVKILPDLAAGTTCATPGNQLGNWLSIIAPSAGQLTTSAAGVPSSTDPCTIPANSGFRGADNRTYRIEIHTPGALGTAQFKYSRNNASVASPITAINGSVLTVVRTKRDSVLRFSPNDWVEVTDDTHEFAGQPGVMCQILSVDDTNLTISLKPSTPLPAGVFDATQPQLHTRVILWDQHGRVFDTNGNLISDVDAHGGLINVPTNATVVLEDGVQVTFSLSSATGQFLVADYWLFVARVIDSSVELLTNAPPRGIHHHFCKLAVVTLPNTPADCRVFWPPDMQGDCECTQCVTADSHNKGTFTIQAAIDLVKSTGGKVCLGPGTYILQSTINISGMTLPVRISGKGIGPMLQAGPAVTTLVAPTPDPKATVPNPAISIQSSIGITIEYLELNFANGTAPDPAGTPVLNPGILIQNCSQVTIQRCMLTSLGNQAPANPAIGLAGLIVQSRIRENIIQFNTQDAQNNITIGGGVGTGVARVPIEGVVFQITFDLYIEDNVIQCRTSGVQLDASFYHVGQLEISRNFIGPCDAAGIEVQGLGFAAIDARIEIDDNEINGTAAGIACGLPARIMHNDIILGPPANPATITPGSSGIVIEPTAFLVQANDGLQIVGNRIKGAAAFGIVLSGALGSVVVRDNLIEATGAGGIWMPPLLAAATHLSICNNQLIGLVPSGANPLVVQFQAAVGILVYTPAVVNGQIQQQGYIQIEGNLVKDFALDANSSVGRGGIVAFGFQSARIAGNQLINIGPAGSAVNSSTGILVAEATPFDRLDISGNDIRRSDSTTAGDRTSSWRSIFILGPLGQRFLGAEFNSAISSGILKQKVVALNDKQFVSISQFGIVAFGENLGLQSVSIRGNHFDSSATVPNVQVTVAGPCIFTENHCTLATDTANPAAFLEGSSVVASNNVLVAAKTALNINSNFFTILGNIVVGSITVNGAPLPQGSPWIPLNTPA